MFIKDVYENRNSEPKQRSTEKFKLKHNRILTNNAEAKHKANIK